MKPFRAIHLLFGILAVIPLAYIAAALVLPPFQHAESSRIEGLEARLERTLEAYRQARGHYPDSLQQALAVANSPHEVRVESDVRKMVYSHTDSGYELSYTGRWYSFTLSVSNDSKGGWSRARTTAR